MAFVLCVWAVRKATCPPTQRKSSYAMMSVHHKASATEGGEECHLDAGLQHRPGGHRPASEDAEMLLQDKGNYRRPPKPRAPPLY